MRKYFLLKEEKAGFVCSMTMSYGLHFLAALKKQRGVLNAKASSHFNSIIRLTHCSQPRKRLCKLCTGFFPPSLMDAFLIKQLPSWCLVFPPLCKPVPWDKQDRVCSFRVDFLPLPSRSPQLGNFSQPCLNIKQVAGMLYKPIHTACKIGKGAQRLLFIAPSKYAGGRWRKQVTILWLYGYRSNHFLATLQMQEPPLFFQRPACVRIQDSTAINSSSVLRLHHALLL